MQFKKIMFSIVFIIHLFSPLTAEQKSATQIIVTILDDSEPALYRDEIAKNGTLRENLGSAATTLLAALLEEQCVIIVNSSVVHYLMRYLQEISNNPLGLIPRLTIEPHNWIKKKISDYLYVLIPKNYAYRLSHYKECKKLFTNSLNAQELTLGIQFKSLRDIGDFDFMNPNNHYHKDIYPIKEKSETFYFPYSRLTSTRQISWISDHYIKHLKNIFITKEAYKNFPHLMPHSIVIAEGHGSPYYSLKRKIKDLEGYGYESQQEVQRLKLLQLQGKIVQYGGQLAGFNSEDFGTFVEFLEENLSVHLLFFNTCYGSEVNTQEALGDAVISFPIISGAISSGVSTDSIGTYESWMSRNYHDVKRDVEIHLIQPNYKCFFEAISPHTYLSDEVCLQALQHIYSFSKKTSDSYNNIPSIKRQGSPWKILKRPGIIILDEKVTEQQNGYSLDISPFLKADTLSIEDREKYPEIILVQTTKIPYEIVFSNTQSRDTPAFISVAPGDAVHHFAKIDARVFLLSSFFRAFFKIPDLHETKMFVIDELVIKNNIKNITPNELIILRNVVVAHEVDCVDEETIFKKSIFFEHNNVEWQVTTTGENAPLVQCLQKARHPENVKQLVQALKMQQFSVHALVCEKEQMNEDREEESQSLLQEEKQDKNNQVIHNSMFTHVLAWFYSFL